ncbi:MAG: hypothetical protein A2Y75_05295 [Candidatus Solincola sediminis]|uniref:Uncharacterized protein n=1 Tax=Candidatus Solincola sediminis TaxID=1797199 RepID=A0A1F2WG46_9ACTN|nr:MAG: hypothetical protein A2Y75_05295 [Candidatus Solincola sediminis]
MVKIKTSFYALLLVLTAGVVVVFAKPRINGFDVSRDSEVMLSATWLPLTHKELVHITYFVSGGKTLTSANSSPWQKIMDVPPGTVVELWVTTREGNFVECNIHQDGIKRSRDTLRTKGTVMCRTTTT